ncbi:peptidase S8/S53 domain-containing protein [Xylariales sp. PMI_506]|nr:peptidase S8/S53 domain-containing protein [Xylariales sp. PMI_506]
MFATAIVPVLLALAGRSLAVPMSVFETLEKPQAGWEGPWTYEMHPDWLFSLHMTNGSQIATPGHALYGQFMTTEEIDAIIAPSDESRDLVFDWLKSEGLGEVSALNWRGNVIEVNTTIEKAESLLNAEYKSYTDSISGRKVFRTLEFSVPTDLLSHIKLVQPTTLFGFRPYGVSPIREVPTNVNVSADATTGCTGIVDPKCLANLYNFATVTPKASGLMGITGFIKQWPSKSDLATFLSKFAITGNTGSSYTCVSVNSGLCPASPASPGDEANLDVQFARGLIGTIPMDFYSTGGEANNIFELFGDYLLQLPAASLPNTVSISYGGDESGVTAALVTATCDVFAQLGAKGVSTLIATGDSGVGSGCSASTGYQPDFPASCPYVTAVGGLTGTASAAAEGGWTDGGGGFSNKFTQPTYQTTAVSKWLSSNSDGGTSYYNAKGRAYPDVAAAAVDFEIIVGGRAGVVDGTSCAAPTFASVIQLINSERVAAGKAALGFLNPFLYENADALTDITTGGNGGCTILGGGFSAIAGWDPSTGLGAPNYAKLLAAAAAA